jgi:hypothetical protein
MNLTKDKTNENKSFLINFDFDCLCDCIISIFFVVKEIEDPESKITIKYY